MKKQPFIYLVCAFILTSCSTEKNLQNKVSQNSSGVPHPAEFSILWHQASGEYRALCHQAFYLAKKRLEEINNHKDKTSAVVLDIDETVLDNSPYMAKLVLEDRAFDDASWMEWTSMEAAAFVPGAQNFLDFIDEINMPIFFISNRDENEIESTMNNLSRLGYEYEPDQFLFKTGNRSKEERRSIVEKDHQIELYIGDNLRDFSDIFDELEHLESNEMYDEYFEEIGKRFIILPNAMYGEWLYNKDADSGLAGDETTSEGVKFRRSKIKGY